MTMPSNRIRRSLSPSVPPAGAADTGAAVNPASRAVNPRTQFPLHFDLLMRDMYARGLVPEQWQVIAADEVRLDESNFDVEFTLVEVAEDRLIRRRVDVQDGKLLRITDG